MFVKGLKFTILAVAGLTTACASYDLEMVKSMPPAGSAFQTALQREYVKVAFDEDHEDDWKDAAYFAGKATIAAKGSDVLPQEIGERMIPDAHRKELSFARSDLMNALAQMDKVGNVAALARAQAQFDCWLQEQEEDTQPADIAKCRLAFEKSMSLLNITQAAPAPMMKMMAKKPEMKMEMKMDPMTFVVYFDHDSAKLGMESGRTIGMAIMAIKKTNPKTVQVGGHADTSGDTTYNNALSDRRAKAVAKLIMAGGFDEKLVKNSMFGEDFTAVNTGDGVKNDKNRRVEIKLKY